MEPKPKKNASVDLYLDLLFGAMVLVSLIGFISYHALNFSNYSFENDLGLEPHAEPPCRDLLTAVRVCIVVCYATACSFVSFSDYRCVRFRQDDRTPANRSRKIE